jgi:hypothetical protein
MADILQTVKSVLSSPSAKRIDFHLGLINVDAAGLAAIHNLVAVGTVAIRVGALKDGVAGQYFNQTNTLRFKREDYGATAFEKATILHECIHALHDMYGGGYYHPKGGSRFVSASENEAAAYVADQLFYLHETGTVQNHDRIADVAGVIAKRIMNRRGAFVTTAEARALRIAIVSNAEYSYGIDTPTGANGP